MTYINKSTTAISLTANIPDAVWTAINGDTNEAKIFVEIKNNGTTQMFNPAASDVTTAGAAGAYTIAISNVPVAVVEGIFSVSVRYTDNVSADASSSIVDIAKAVFSKVALTVTIACS